MHRVAESSSALNFNLCRQSEKCHANYSWELRNGIIKSRAKNSFMKKKQENFSKKSTEMSEIKNSSENVNRVSSRQQ